MDGIIPVNKPSGITSHDLVQKARKKLGTSRIGHTGTLDPLAEGLMILTVGKATKILPFLSHCFKEYVATMKLGIRTDTLDVTGEVLETADVREYDDETINGILQSFLGDSLQMPPMYSAKKVNGKKLYELARKNREIERPKQPITVREMELLSHHGNVIIFRTVCSTGTYVRVLIEDIAEKLGTVAVMSALKRTAIDRYLLEDACQIDQLDENVRLISAYEALNNYHYVEVEDISDVMNGKPLKLDEDLPDTVMITHEGEVLACYERQNGMFYCRRGLW
ncbi:MAG: tRNA pseudouridine(55) synthase TruB [Erysipelotrichaceae bacterium]|nr:tRNA pseudouridine(55) synthase TruB [Erysipelotrichaceae bacterium]